MKTEAISYFIQVIEALKRLFLENPFLGILCSLLIVIFLLIIILLLGVIFRNKDESILQGVLNVLGAVGTVAVLLIFLCWIFWDGLYSGLQFLLYGAIGTIGGAVLGFLIIFIPVGLYLIIRKLINRE